MGERIELLIPSRLESLDLVASVLDVGLLERECAIKIGIAASLSLQRHDLPHVIWAYIYGADRCEVY